MAEIIKVTDLPASIQSAEVVDTMVAGANAKASRVAPCLTAPTAAAWAGSTAYAVGDVVSLGTNEFVKVTVAGTSAATAPTAPANIGDTVTDGTVTWQRIAPTPDQLAEAKLVLIGAVKRWVEAGAGALQSQTAGAFSMTVDTRQKSSGFNLWPSEISQLQDICKGDESSGAFSVDAGSGGAGRYPGHSLLCALYFGADYCSCGYALTGTAAIYE